jgi:hypothetical protein
VQLASGAVSPAATQARPAVHAAQSAAAPLVVLTLNEPAGHGSGAADLAGQCSPAAHILGLVE